MKQIISHEEFLHLSANLNYQLALTPAVNWGAVMQLIMDDRQIARADTVVLMDAMKCVGNCTVTTGGNSGRLP